MAHFYGKLQGNRGEATRCGTKVTGMEITCASWAGAVQCTAYVDDRGVDCVLIQKILWCGHGVSQVLYDGPMGEGVGRWGENHIDNSPHFSDAE